MKYASVNAKGHVDYFIDSAFDQPDTQVVNFEVPPPPALGWSFHFDTQTWVDARSEADILQMAEFSVRDLRDSLLSGCDWTQLPDIAEEVQQSWKAYRQSLRDITLQSGFPMNIQWPAPPSK